jgi:hypothetical protein
MISEARLTYDTIERVLSYINIGHVNSAIEILGAYMDDNAKEKLKHIREDIKPMFNDLINNFKELLRVMRESKVVLSGSRLINFFKPGYSSRESDYDFYAKDNAYYIAIFMVYMTSIGVH